MAEIIVGAIIIFTILMVVHMNTEFPSSDGYSGFENARYTPQPHIRLEDIVSENHDD